MMLDCEHAPDQEFPNSVIVTKGHFIDALSGWLLDAGFTPAGPPLYRASLDGFAAANFHRLCDNKGGTLTIIRSSTHILGAFWIARGIRPVGG